MISTALLLFVLAFGLSVLILPIGRRVALSHAFVDRPGGRKKHETPVPPIGGLVVFPVFMGFAALCNIDWSVYWALFIAIALLLAVGAVDDKKGVPARIKFGVQFLAAILIVVPGQAQLVMLGDLFGFGRFGLNIFAIPFSVIATVLLINAVNLMDGLDGLAAGKGFIILFWLAVASVAANAFVPLMLLAILMGALGGFLVFNLRHPLRERASIFLGDSGSMTLGLCLAWFSIHLAKGFDPVIWPISVAWLLALPIYDICGQFARRISRGRHPFDADHDHFHHHFIYAGFPVRQATAIILAIVFASGFIGIGVMMLGLPAAVLTYPWIALLLLHIYMSMRPHRFRRLIARLRPEDAAAGEDGNAGKRQNGA